MEGTPVQRKPNASKGRGGWCVIGDVLPDCKPVRRLTRPFPRLGYAGGDRCNSLFESVVRCWDGPILLAAVTHAMVVLLASFSLDQARRPFRASAGRLPIRLQYSMLGRIVDDLCGHDRASASADEQMYMCYAASHDLRRALRARQSVRRLPGAWSERRCLVVDGQCRILLRRAGEHRQRRGERYRLGCTALRRPPR